METSLPSAFDCQQVSKNKRKKFNPRCMLTNNSSDDDESGHGTLKDQDQIVEENQANNDGQQPNRNEVIKQISKSTFSITKEQRSNSPSHLFMAPSKQMFLQSYNFQQQQQMFQHAAMNIITPQFSQQLESATDLNETKAMFREFAFKTMQDLLNIYGLPLPTNEIIDAMNQVSPSASSHPALEPPTPPRTPIINSQSLLKSVEKNHNNNNNDASEENFEENSASENSNRRGRSGTREYEEYSQQSSHFHDESNLSDGERSGREGFISEALRMNGVGEESDPEESDCASSFDSSKMSIKNIEKFLDKSPMSFYNPMVHLNTLQSDQAEKHLIAEYSKYLTKYQSYVDCHSEQCQSENQRDHYHCYDIQCYNKVLNKKEEIIRHLKWHKKRSESLNHGFLRFTSSDDCTIQFGYCQHNRKQTHYHCIQNKCDKTYISTSDVQMHSNYHRKDSAIYQEGFQRYRATEKCMVQHCIFYGQCTTHFHCRRCKYTFKNKADMEKHKTYHMKDEQLFKDGFKKFLKTEPCKVDGCRFTMICNHIHCVRSNCSYVLHSSGQLLSHKRKHERMDAEMAYRRFKMGQTAKDLTPSELAALHSFHGLDLSPKPPPPAPMNQFPVADQAMTEKFNKLLNNATMENLNSLLSHTVANTSNVTPELLKEIREHQKKVQSGDRESQRQEADENGESLEDGIPKSVIQNVAMEDENKSPTVEEVENIISQYFTDQCTKQQSTSDEPLDLNLKAPSNKSGFECFMSNNEPHLHCLITGCEAVVPRSLQDISEHLRMHELNRDSIIQNSNLLQITSIEGFFNRKRGRPPKNRVVEVYNNAHHPPQAIFTSFKLERNEQKNSPALSSASSASQSKNLKVEKQSSPVSANSYISNIEIVQSTEKCSDTSCVYKKLLHYHCSFSKFCHFSTNQLALMDQHLSSFHSKIEIQENYDYFDRNYDCKLSTCCNNKITSHFHCLLCKFSFSIPSEMSEHICEENIEENYESFDAIENDIIKARAQATSQGPRSDRNTSSRDERFQEKFFESKVALNSDVDLIKTSKVPFATVETAEDDKVSVVRAAGTWVPHGSSESGSKNDTSDLEAHLAGPSSRDIASCDRPFCKLKRKSHEHCDLCNQGFTDSIKLKIHYLKHKHTKLGGSICDDSEEDKCEPAKFNEEAKPHDLSKSSQIAAMANMAFSQGGPVGMMDGMSLQNLQLANLAHFYQQNSLYYQNLYPFLGNQQLPLFQLPATAAALAANANFDFASLGVPSLSSPKRKLELFENPLPLKKQKTSERPKEYQKKSYKDDSVPKGYLKFRFNQDCNFPNCGYRNHQSHFHCIRKDCFYSFCDKTRFVQHTARHERLDKLMGDDFKQFRANMHCGFANCAYNKNLGPHNKSSHFHCLKCNYICSDTNKVVAHRRHHSKQEYIKLSGFSKYSANEHCNIPCNNTPDGECPYTLKQNHFHCLGCSVGVLSRNQLSYHNCRQTNISGEEAPKELSNEKKHVILNENGSDEHST